MISRLTEYCLYCEVTEAPYSSRTHWWKECYRVKGGVDVAKFEEYMTELTMINSRFRIRQRCWGCGGYPSQCGIAEALDRSSVCRYRDVVLAVMFVLLARRNSRDRWLGVLRSKYGYVGVGHMEYWRWISGIIEQDGQIRARAVGVFEEWAVLFWGRRVEESRE